MGSNSCASGMFPSNDTVTRHLLPSAGSRRARFPEFDGTMKCSDFLRPSRRASLSFAWRYHAVCPSLRSLRTRHETAGLGLIIRNPLPEVTHGDDSGSPRFLEIPLVPSLCSTTTAGPTRQAIRRSRHGPCFRQQQRLTAISHFSGLHHRALALAVYASPSGLPAADARLASRCWPLCGAGLITCRIPSKGFKVASYISPPFPKLPGAMTM